MPAVCAPEAGSLSPAAHARHPDGENSARPGRRTAAEPPAPRRLVPLCLHQRISADVLEMAAAAAPADAAGGGGTAAVEGGGQRQLPFSELKISGGSALAMQAAAPSSQHP